MRLSGLIATAASAVGVGLVSGAVTQVAALDGDLQRAAAPSTPAPLVRADERGRPDGARCLHDRRPAAVAPEPT
jgi:hypothetical protein